MTATSENAAEKEVVEATPQTENADVEMKEPPQAETVAAADVEMTAEAPQAEETAAPMEDVVAEVPQEEAPKEESSEAASKEAVVAKESDKSVEESCKQIVDLQTKLVEAAAASRDDVAAKLLKQLAKIPVSLKVLKKTNIGKTMNDLRKKYTLAAELRTKWLAVFREAELKKKNAAETALVPANDKDAKAATVLRSASEPLPEQLRIASSDENEVKLAKLIQTVIWENHNKQLDQVEIFKRLTEQQAAGMKVLKIKNAAQLLTPLHKMLVNETLTKKIRMVDANSASAAKPHYILSDKTEKAMRKAKDKQAKDPNAPKRPQSAYFLFAQEERPKLMEAERQEHGEDAKFNVAKMGKKLGEMWAEASEEVKKSWYDKAAALKAQYEVDLEAYKNSDAFKQWCKDPTMIAAEPIDPKAPSKPASAFEMWFEAKKTEFEKNPKLKAQQKAFDKKKARGFWEHKMKARKKEWVDKEQKALAEYKAELKAYQKTADYRKWLAKLFKSHPEKALSLVKDPAAPKQPATAFFLWSSENRTAEMKADENGKFNLGAIGKKLGDMWAQLPESTKEEWQVKATEAKEAWKKELEIYHQSDSHKEFRRKLAAGEQIIAPPKSVQYKDPNRPKAPLTGYQFWAAAERENAAAEREEARKKFEEQKEQNRIQREEAREAKLREEEEKRKAREAEREKARLAKEAALAAEEARKKEEAERKAKEKEERLEREAQEKKEAQERRQREKEEREKEKAAEKERLREEREKQRQIRAEEKKKAAEEKKLRRELFKAQNKEREAQGLPPLEEAPEEEEKADEDDDDVVSPAGTPDVTSPPQNGDNDAEMAAEPDMSPPAGESLLEKAEAEEAAAEQADVVMEAAEAAIKASEEAPKSSEEAPKESPDAPKTSVEASSKGADEVSIASGDLDLKDVEAAIDAPENTEYPVSPPLPEEKDVVMDDKAEEAAKEPFGSPQPSPATAAKMAEEEDEMAQILEASMAQAEDETSAEMRAAAEALEAEEEAKERERLEIEETLKLQMEQKAQEEEAMKAKKMAERWEKLTEEEKGPWMQQAEEAQKAYVAALAEYEKSELYAEFQAKVKSGEMEQRRQAELEEVRKAKEAKEAAKRAEEEKRLALKKQRQAEKEQKEDLKEHELAIREVERENKKRKKMISEWQKRVRDEEERKMRCEAESKPYKARKVADLPEWAFAPATIYTDKTRDTVESIINNWEKEFEEKLGQMSKKLIRRAYEMRLKKKEGEITDQPMYKMILDQCIKDLTTGAASGA